MRQKIFTGLTRYETICITLAQEAGVINHFLKSDLFHETCLTSGFWPDTEAFLRFLMSVSKLSAFSVLLLKVTLSQMEEE